MLSKEERSQGAKRAKNRGASFERKVAKAFNEAFVGTLYEKTFCKTPSSGGLRWSKERTDVIGDIVTPATFRFTIECKKHEDLDYEVLFLTREANTVSDFISFWEQTCKEAIRAKREPLLVVEKKQGLSIAVLPERVFRDVIHWETCKDVVITAHISLKKESNKGCWHSVVMIPLKEFLNRVIMDKLFVEEHSE